MDPQTAATSANDQHTPDNIESTQVPITLLETTEIHLNYLIQIKRKIMSPYRWDSCNSVFVLFQEQIEK